ncbi:MAG: PAS domain-containing protein [Gemmatimonadetes bacterium]|nr:PAS domain-containing protein [Gemmatimonadota bacterium]
MPIEPTTPLAPDDVSTLLEALSSQLVVIDGEGQIVSANSAWRNRTRIADYFTAFQMVTRPELELVAQVRRGVERVQRGSEAEFVTEFPVRLDGEDRWLLLRAAPVGAPETRRVLIAHVDITARKRAERLSSLQHEVLSLVVADTPLRTTLERLAQALEQECPGGTVAVLIRPPESETVILGGGPSLPLGLADQLDGLGIEELMHFVDGPAIADINRLPRMPWVAAAQAHGFQSLATIPIRSKNGSDLGVLMLAYRTVGAPPQATKNLLDVGASLAAVAIERNRTARALRERETRFNSVFTLQPDAVFTLDRDGAVVTANPAAEHLLGEATADLVGLQFGGLVPERDRPTFARHLEKALTGYPQRFSLVIHPAGRSRIDADTTLVPLVSDGGVGGVYLVAKDITEQLAAADRLAQSSKQLRQSAKMEAVGRLAGGIAHDFNNLLTAIRGYTDLLLANGEIGGSSRGDLEEIARAVGRASSLTRQLLAFSRQQVVQPRLVDLNAVVDECRGILSRLVRADTEVTVQACAEPVWVQADPVQIHQVVINLAVNAHDAMPNGGRLTIETGRHRAGLERDEALVPLEPHDYVTLTVTDTGRGMDAEIQAHVFEPFFTTKPPGQGTGLGLSTVYGIVEQSGGRIGFRSAPDQGTTFVIYLPATAAPEGVADRIGAAPPLPTGTETILLAEDEESVRTMVRKILTGAGYSVLEARHGADALLVSREYQGKIDLLLTDVVMPEMNGLRLAQWIAAERPDTQIVFMSGYTRDEVDRKGLTQPGVSFIHKPFTVNELANTVREVLDRRPAPAP